jgi:hypothetical protein
VNFIRKINSWQEENLSGMTTLLDLSVKVIGGFSILGPFPFLLNI